MAKGLLTSDGKARSLWCRARRVLKKTRVHSSRRIYQMRRKREKSKETRFWTAAN